MYSNCPHCGNKYDEEGTTKKNTYKCSYCSFTFYNNPKPVVNGFILGSDGRSFLMAQRKSEPYKGRWGIPGGFLHYGEDPKDALKRELKEELCIDVKVGRLLGTYNEIYHNVGSKEEAYSVVVLVYLTEVSDISVMKADDDALAFKFFPFGRLSNLAFENQYDFLAGIFKSLYIAQYRVSAKAVIRDDKNRVLLCKEKNGSWDFPGGGIDYGETAQEAIRREVKEEMGVEVETVGDKPIAVVFDQFHDTKAWFSNIFFETTVSSYEITPSDECQEIGFFSKETIGSIKAYSSVQKFFDLQV